MVLSVLRSSPTKFSAEHHRRPDPTVSCDRPISNPTRAIRNVPKLMILKKLPGYESTKNFLQFCHHYVGTGPDFAQDFAYPHSERSEESLPSPWIWLVGKYSRDPSTSLYRKSLAGLWGNQGAQPPACPTPALQIHEGLSSSSGAEAHGPLRPRRRLKKRSLTALGISPRASDAAKAAQPGILRLRCASLRISP